MQVRIERQRRIHRTRSNCSRTKIGRRRTGKHRRCGSQFGRIRGQQGDVARSIAVGRIEKLSPQPSRGYCYGNTSTTCDSGAAAPRLVTALSDRRVSE